MIRVHAQTLVRPLLAGLACAAIAGLAAGSPAAPARAQSQTDVCTAIVGGIVPADTVWTSAGSPYLITCALRVESQSSSLRIEPGVVVKFTTSGRLDVRGPLTVAGAAPADVEFTADKEVPKAGDWNGVTINDPAVVSIEGATFHYAATALNIASSGTTVRHVVVEKSSGSGIVVNRATNVTIDDVVLRENGNYGLELNDRSDSQMTATLTNSTFEQNAMGAVRRGANLDVAHSGNKARRNGVNGMVIDSGSPSAPVTWRGRDLPYVIKGFLQFRKDLTVEAGTVVKFGFPFGSPSTSHSIRFDGSAIAVNGTADSPVYFTAIGDDQACNSTDVDCDTANDGAGTPLPGSWQRLDFGPTATGGTFNHVEFRYGQDGMIKTEAPNFRVDHGVFTKSQGHAVFVNNVSFHVTSSRFVDNRGNGLSMAARQPVDLTLTDSVFEANTTAVTIAPDVNMTNSGNTARGNQINGYVVTDGKITRPRVWRAGDLPFVVDTRATVDLSESHRDPLLTLQPGVVVKMNTDARIVASKGGLKIGEAEGARVLITSLKDDACSAADTAKTCDTNNGGGTPGPGDWSRIEVLRASEAASIVNVAVRYGGNAQSPAVEILNANTILDNLEIERSLTSGLRVKQVSLAVHGSHIHHNQGAGLIVEGLTTPAQVTLEGNRITDNLGAAIEIDANVVVLPDDPNTPGSPPNVIQGNTIDGIAVKGNIDRADRVWEPLAGIAFVVTSNIDIIESKTLTIKGGTIIKFKDGGINVRRGALRAEGTEAAPVILTSAQDDSVGGSVTAGDGDPAPGNWTGVVFDELGSGQLTWTEVRYAGKSASPGVTIKKKGMAVGHLTVRDGAGPGILVNIPSTDATIGTVEISDSTIERMLGDGIQIMPQGTVLLDPILSRNTIKRSQVAIRIGPNIQPALDGNLAEGNALNGVLVAGTMTQPRTWQKSNLAWVVGNSLEIGSGATLQVNAGAVVKFERDGILRTQPNGSLVVTGDERSGPVVLTSVRDDAAGCPAGTPATVRVCDTNGEGSGNPPRPGDWKGIEISTNTRVAEIFGAKLTYAGSSQAALIIRGSRAALRQSEVAESATNGVAVSSAADVIVSDNTIHHNRDGAAIDLSGEVGTTPETTGITIENNRLTDNRRSVVHYTTFKTKMANNVAVGNVSDAMWVRSTVKSNQEWQGDLVREIESNLLVEAGKTLDIKPGAVVQFSSTGGLQVLGGLRAEGAIFTSSKRLPTTSEYWSGLMMGPASTGFIRHSAILFGSRGATGALNVLAEQAPIEIQYNTLMRLGGSGIVVNRNTSSQTKIEANLIRDLSGNQTVGIQLSGGMRGQVDRNRLADMAFGIKTLDRSFPASLRYNSFSNTSDAGVDNGDASQCIEAGQNWWNDTSGPLDKTDQFRDPCGVRVTNEGRGVKVSNNVRYTPWLTVPPPVAPLVDAPSCGVTNRDDQQFLGSAAPNVRVQILDGDQVVGEATAGGDGRFRADVRLASGPRKLSFQSVASVDGATVTSPRTGFRVVTVDKTSAIDPAGIRFEYGPPDSPRLQPIRDIAGCVTACGGPTSGRVTLPRDTEVRVRVRGPIQGAPRSVVFTQPGQPDRALQFDGADWRTEPFKPVQGTFTIKVDDAADKACLGYVYLGGAGFVFADVGAPGDPLVPFPFRFEDASGQGVEGKWVGEGEWDLTAEGFRSKWSFANPGLGVDAGGNPVRKKYRPNTTTSLTYGEPFSVQGVVSPQLTFWHKLRLAAGDRAVVELRVGDSTTWTPLLTFNPGTVVADWRGEMINLDRYILERSLQLRFKLEVDRAPETVDEGWYIDDVSIGPGGAGNRRYDEGEPLRQGARVFLRQRQPDTGAWGDWSASPTGQSNPQLTGPDGNYGFYNLPMAEYLVIVQDEELGVHSTVSMPVWDGTYSLPVPISGSTPLYLPMVVKSAPVRQ